MDSAVCVQKYSCRFTLSSSLFWRNYNHKYVKWSSMHRMLCKCIYVKCEMLERSNPKIQLSISSSLILPGNYVDHNALFLVWFVGLAWTLMTFDELIWHEPIPPPPSPWPLRLTTSDIWWNFIHLRIATPSQWSFHNEWEGTAFTILVGAVFQESFDILRTGIKIWNFPIVFQNWLFW